MKRIIHSDLLKYLRDYQPVIRSGFMPKYHAILCDPPYYLGSIVKRFGAANAAPAVHGADGRWARLSTGFMGQTWDGFDSPQSYQAWVTTWAEMLLDFVYPGAVLMAFGGTRTYHRLVSGLEDAGWEIYDSIMAWTYGSGFPKSYDVGKNTNEQFNGYGTALKPSYEPIVLARAPRAGYTYADCATQFGSGALNIDGCRIGVGDDRVSGGNSGGSNLFSGLGTGYERPTEGRFPANTMLVHHPECNGTCHFECHVRVMGEQSGILEPVGSAKKTTHDSGMFGIGVPGTIYKDTGTAARFFYQAKAASWERDAGLADMPLAIGGGMQGTADKSLKTGSGNERNNLRHNPHPTVKPIQLITELAKLILPPIDNARLLVPFAGSGSEMIGASLAGWQHITGIEMTAEYIPVARARLAWWERFDSYAMAESHIKNHDDKQLTLFEYMAHLESA